MYIKDELTKLILMAESNPGEQADENIARGNIEDMGAAAEMAYAEKPFRDAEADYRERLSPEARQALDYIASQEAGKALARYEETKNAEDPLVRTLHENAERTLEIPRSIAALAEDPKAKIGTLDAKEWVRRSEWGIREFGREEIESILKSGIDNRAKQAFLQRIPGELGDGLKHVARQWERRGGESERWHGAELRLSRANVLEPWGTIIGDIMAGEGIHDFVANEMLRSGMRTEDIIDAKIGFYERARVSFPAVGFGLDASLEKYGWVWDDKQKKYIKL